MIPLAEPNLTGKEQEYVAEAIASGWVSGGGPFVERFEDMVARASGREWAVATLTGTAALHVAIVQDGCWKAQSVGVSAMTFIATANALSLAGGKPQFQDIGKRWTPDYSAVWNVTDAAAAIGQWTSPIGTTCFSFNGNKTVTTGQGGAVVGDGPDGEKQIRHLVNVAKVNQYEHDAVGFNYRMPNLNAAMGCAQMERLPEFLERKRAIMARYREAGLDLVPSQWMAIAKFDDRDTALSTLEEQDIDARPFWFPLHLQVPYCGCPRDPLPNTEAIWHKLVCLPCSTNLTEADQDKVIKCVSSL